MVIGIRNVEWLDHNAQRAYPITRDATAVDETETFTLPTDFLVSLYLPTHWGLNVEPSKFFLLKLVSAPQGYQLTIGYDAVGGAIEVASASIAADNHHENKVYNLIGIGDYANTRGFLAIGTLENIEKEAAGTFYFDLEGTRLESDVVRPNIQSVTSIQLQNGSELSTPLSGRLIMQAGRNFRFRVEEEAGEDPVVILDAIDGVGLTEDCICDEGLPDPLRSINGFGPDGDGNMRVLGNDCLSVGGTVGTVTLEDECSQPCCGCTELEAITAALESFGERATTLENFLVSLEARVTQMDQVILGSRLGDRGCTPATECP